MNIIKPVCLLVLMFFSKPLLAQDYPSSLALDWNPEKHQLVEESFQETDSLITEGRQEKSILRATLYSAVLPGSGQYYAGSVWKAMLFAGLEAAGWLAYFTYNSKGRNKENEVENFANTHWSEHKYWSRLYYDATQRGDISNLPLYQVDENDMLVEYNSNVVASLRFLEDALGHTHKLPETKTQQYYEMIYKYLTQFGNGWEDANFYSTYYGNTNNMTAQMFSYRDLRNDMNGYFDVATTAANLVMVNHILSALDAAWTTRNYNRQVSMKIRAYNKRYFDENVQMVGVNVTW